MSRAHALPSRRAAFLTALAVALTLAASCGDQPPPIAAADRPRGIAVQVVAGDVQQGEAGRELPEALRVRVVDEDEQPIGGFVVNFRVVSGSGSVFAGATLTDKQGRAADWWTLGPATADTQRVEVRAVDPVTAERRVYATFRAVTARPNGSAGFTLRADPSSLTLLPGTTRAVTLAVERSGGFDGGIAFAANGVPAGMTVATPPIGAGASMATATVAVGASVAAGSYPVALRAVGAGVPDQLATLLVTVESSGTPSIPPPGPLTSGATHAGRLAQAGQIDTWTFAANQGDYVAVSVGKGAASGDFAPWVRLVGPGNVELTGNAGSEVAQVARTIPATGQYSVTVASGDTRRIGTGDYRLSFVKAPGESTVSPGDEGGVLTNGGASTGRITLGDVDVWTFPASQGDYVILSLAEGAPATVTSEFAPWLRVIDPSGDLLTNGASPAVQQYNAPARTTGTYTVIVASGDGGRNGVGDYRLTLVRAPGATTVPAGDEGGALTNGVTHAGRVTMGDLDVWTFTATQGDYLALSLAQGDPATVSAAFSPWLRVIGPTGALLENDAGRVAQVDRTAPLTGTYHVVVGTADAGRDATGDYRLTLARAPGEFTVATGDEGGAMRNGVAYTGKVTLGDLDVWTFHATQGSSLVLTLARSADAASSERDFRPGLRLIGPTGTLHRTTSDPTSARATLTAPATGTYTVIVWSADSGNDAAGEYTLTVSGASSAATAARVRP